MKTLTEFSGTIVRMAANAVAEARKALPKEALSSCVPSLEPPPAVAAQPSDGVDARAPVVGLDSPSDAEGQALAVVAAEPKPGEAGSAEAGSTEDPDAVARKEKAISGKDLSGAGAGETPAPPSPAPEQAEATAASASAAKAAPEAEVESDAARAALDEAVAKATGTTGDRLQRLREALKVVGNQADRVRLVRVFSNDDEVPGAKKIGEHQYVVDLMPASMKQEFRGKEERGGRRGPRRPSGGGAKGKGESLEGSFSMESVVQDRRKERGPGGRPGAGRGGRPAGGRPGGRSKP